MRTESPTDKAGVERLKGNINYLSKIVFRLSEIIQPVNAVAHANTARNWDAAQDKAFEEVKRLLKQAPVLAYFKLTLRRSCLFIVKTVGIVWEPISCKKQPQTCESRTLRNAENNYITIVKEMLDIAFALEKCHLDTFSWPVVLCLDHKSLEPIIKKPIDWTPKRLQGIR